MEQARKIKIASQFIDRQRFVNRFFGFLKLLYPVILMLPLLVWAVDVNLQKDFNLFSYPVEPSINLSCGQFQDQIGAEKISRLNPQTQLFEDCGSTTGDFLIFPGEGYVINMFADALTPLNGITSCPVIDLVKGMNLIGVPTPSQGMGCFQLLQTLGDNQTVATLQRYNLLTGKIEGCGYEHFGLSSTPLGTDFSIKPGEGYWVSMKTARNNVALNDSVLCPPPSPVIQGFIPQSAPVGTLVTLNGDQFAPLLSTRPQVTMNKRGGGMTHVPVVNTTQIAQLFAEH